MSALEETLVLHLKAEGIDGWVREHRFHPVRRWRFDFAWPELMFAAEVEGGTWVHGRHTRGAGVAKDLEKYNEAMLLGWNVARFDSGMVKSGKAIDTIKIFLEREQCNG
jgi:very-short-patch-repair endonuclease